MKVGKIAKVEQEANMAQKCWMSWARGYADAALTWAFYFRPISRPSLFRFFIQPDDKWWHHYYSAHQAEKDSQNGSDTEVTDKDEIRSYKHSETA